jgi:hypothetical protein
MMAVRTNPEFLKKPFRSTAGIHLFGWPFVMSSTLFNVLFAWKCSSTHHKLALDALNHIRGGVAENWRNLCLKNIETYLDGSKAPDNKFKDFKNHVLHVRDNYWGGAVAATQKWYDATVAALRDRKWSDAVYAAGVLSHYYTDPIQPFHTGQCEAEGIVHRAAEWSIACAYRELTEILEADLGGWPEVSVPDGPDWLARMVTAGADLANPHYEVCIEHYDMRRGVKDPPTGLDQEMKDRLAKLIGHAVVGYARIMERAFADSAASPPATGITLLGIMAQLTIPLFWVTKKLKDAKERAIVEATFKEFQATGKVVDSLTEDDFSIRELHATEVLKKPLADLDAEEPTPVGTAHGIGAPARPRPAKPARVVVPATPKAAAAPKAVAAPVHLPAPSEPVPKAAAPSTALAHVNAEGSPEHDRYHLDRGMPVEKAPSIGAKTAALLERHGVKTVGDLLSADPDRLADAVKDRHIHADTILTWQRQAGLCCEVPNLRGHDAQFLTACGISHRTELSVAHAEPLLKKVDAFVATPAGERILRGGDRPDLKEVTNWIAWANRPVRSKAA